MVSGKLLHLFNNGFGVFILSLYQLLYKAITPLVKFIFAKKIFSALQWQVLID